MSRSPAVEPQGCHGPADTRDDLTKTVVLPIGGMLAVMTDSFPDEVPVADAVEQTRAAADVVGDEDPDPDESPALESDSADWQEQREVVDGFDDDEFR